MLILSVKGARVFRCILFIIISDPLEISSDDPDVLNGTGRLSGWTNCMLPADLGYQASVVHEVWDSDGIALTEYNFW